MPILLLDVSKRGEDTQSHMGNSEIVIGWRKMGRPLWLSSKKKKKNLPAIQQMQIRSLGREDSLEEGMATHSRITAWIIPGTEEPGRLQAMGSQSWTRLKQLSLHAGRRKIKSENPYTLKLICPLTQRKVLSPQSMSCKNCLVPLSACGTSELPTCHH